MVKRDLIVESCMCTRVHILFVSEHTLRITEIQTFHTGFTECCSLYLCEQIHRQLGDLNVYMCVRACVNVRIY